MGDCDLKRVCVYVCVYFSLDYFLLKMHLYFFFFFFYKSNFNETPDWKEGMFYLSYIEMCTSDIYFKLLFNMLFTDFFFHFLRLPFLYMQFYSFYRRLTYMKNTILRVNFSLFSSWDFILVRLKRSSYQSLIP